jgi:hypothetical protein
VLGWIGCWGQCENDNEPSSADSGSLQPRSDPACRRARASQGQALRVAAKTRPALTGPARGGCALWRSGRKNARGAGRTKEWTPTWIISKEIADLCRAPAASSCSVSILDAVHTPRLFGTTALVAVCHRRLYFQRLAVAQTDAQDARTVTRPTASKFAHDEPARNRRDGTVRNPVCRRAGLRSPSRNSTRECFRSKRTLAIRPRRAGTSWSPTTAS